jgi:hypothetical protein
MWIGWEGNEKMIGGIRLGIYNDLFLVDVVSELDVNRSQRSTCISLYSHSNFGEQ